MKDIHQLRKFYKLKEIERAGPVGKRKESSAEHSWSCLILADYFLSLMKNSSINRTKVYELLIYHDVVEIEAGDIPIHHTEKRKKKKTSEMKALKNIKKQIPHGLKGKFEDLFLEFEAAETKEAKFAKAIDALDALIHFLDYKEYWKGWNEEMVRQFHGRKVISFVETQDAFEKILTYVKKEGYFKQ
ncbi:MAG: HD domain-containing protein [Nanoarchaeota archaeon]|nr:HD domain-containing protein [Nanoarchaeota archaeon]MBU1622679.1 HD domain-containing protein [Nanoarchaeota archaeon]MBU1973910.1 HD domain-containing protein [Nanoarchaeota archaeon]